MYSNLFNQKQAVMYLIGKYYQEIKMIIGNKIIKNLMEGRLIEVTIKKIRKSIDFALAILTRTIYTKFQKIDNKKVMFMTYNNNYICNPKYICDEIIRQKLPLDLVWATTTKQLTSDQYPPELRLVVRGKYEFFREAASAKVWVDNAVCFPWNPIYKKKNQFYLQTWHGSMGLKRIGKEDVKNRRWSWSARLMSKWTNVCISNSTFETEVFRETHWSKTPIEEWGHARNDILFSSDERKKEIKKKVYDFFSIPYEKKIMLYAPTFRNDQRSNPYSMDYEAILSAVEEKFGGEWVLLNRFHFKSKKISQIMDERIYSATEYTDMQELIIAADVGITDYSSWICDFVLTRKPGFIFAPDLNTYNKERGFYYPLDSTPFPIAENNEELQNKIREFDSSTYSKKCEIFLNERGCKENGDAAKKIVELIKVQCGIK